MSGLLCGNNTYRDTVNTLQCHADAYDPLQLLCNLVLLFTWNKQVSCTVVNLLQPCDVHRATLSSALSSSLIVSTILTESTQKMVGRVQKKKKEKKKKKEEKD